MDHKVQITKTRVMCAVIGCMILGVLILGIAELIGGSFLAWVIGISSLACVLLFGSMIREL